MSELHHLIANGSTFRSYCKSVLVLTVLGLAIAGCGSRQKLVPQAGNTLPQAAYGAHEPATAAELIEPSTQARPERSVELLGRSEARKEDPFDLPPE